MVSAHTPGRSPGRRAQSPVVLAQLGDCAPLVSAAKALLRAPFDAMREQYASAVRAGLIERSLLASARFEHKLGALERTTLGPWARRV
ncbi:hypothetical protein [Thiomonas sp.]